MSKKRKVWREAVREWMYEKAYDEAERKSDVKKPAFMYRWEHVNAVVVTALRLADLTGADREVVEAAAWLHDVRKDAKERHPQEGAAFARKYLPKTNFPKKKIEATAQAIEDHMGLWRDKPLKSLESQVLWDADKLTKIGVVAAFHWIGGDIARGRDSSTERMIEQLESADFRKKTVASMHTKPAKKAAKARFKAYDRMVAQLSTEWRATDL